MKRHNGGTRFPNMADTTDGTYMNIYSPGREKPQLATSLLICGLGRGSKSSDDDWCHSVSDLETRASLIVTRASLLVHSTPNLLHNVLGEMSHSRKTVFSFRRLNHLFVSSVAPAPTWPTTWLDLSTGRDCGPGFRCLVLRAECEK